MDPFIGGPASLTAKELLATLPDRFDPAAAPGLHAVVQLDLTGAGDDGGRYHIVIRDGGLEVLPGVHPSPGLSIRAAGRDYVDLATGKLTRQKAFLDGRLKLSGNVALAEQLRSAIGLG
jgi:putative sterol carrier protein